MKYFPLIWAAIMRKPARAVLTLLSVMIAFTLFGLTIGMNATFASVEAKPGTDRIYTRSALRRQRHARCRGAAQIAACPAWPRSPRMSFIDGYHQDPKNRAFVMMVDPAMRAGAAPTGRSARRSNGTLIQNNRTGVVISSNRRRCNGI